MVEQEKEKITGRTPLFTLFVGAAVLAAYAFPSLSALLEYNRAAIAGGQVWRVMSGNMVHYSWSHLFFNLTVFMITGWVMEQRGYPWFRSLCTLTGILTGAVLFLGCPDISMYGGLSGVATFQCTFMALHGVSRKVAERLIGGAFLLLIAGKLAFECRVGDYLFVNAGQASFVPVPLAHLVGFITAFVGFGALSLYERVTGEGQPKGVGRNKDVWRVCGNGFEGVGRGQEP